MRSVFRGVHDGFILEKKGSQALVESWGSFEAWKLLARKLQVVPYWCVGRAYACDAIFVSSEV